MTKKYIKTCHQCGVTDENVIRYPTRTTDATINYCDKCVYEVGYIFHQHMYYATKGSV